jgi:hypothetical protein
MRSSPVSSSSSFSSRLLLVGESRRTRPGTWTDDSTRLENEGEGDKVEEEIGKQGSWSLE